MSEHLPPRGRTRHQQAVDRFLADSGLEGDAELRTELLELRSLADTAPVPSEAVRALMVRGPGCSHPADHDDGWSRCVVGRTDGGTRHGDDPAREPDAAGEPAPAETQPMGAPSLPTNLLRGDGRSVARPLPASPSWCPWPAVQLLRPRPTAESRVPSSILARPSAQWSRSSLLVPATLRSRAAPPVPLRCRLLRRRPQFPTGASPPRHPLPLVQAASPGRIPFRSPAEERRLKNPRIPHPTNPGTAASPRRWFL